MNEVKYLDSQKNFVEELDEGEEKTRVFQLNGVMLTKRPKEPNKCPTIQLECKNVSDWYLTVKNGELRVWAKQIGNLLGGEPTTRLEYISEAVCDVHDRDFMYVRFVPKNFSCDITNETGLVRSTTRRMAVEFYVECGGEYNRSIAIGHFFSADNSEEFFAFVEEVVKECGISPLLLNNFEWHGTRCVQVDNFKK